MGSGGYYQLVVAHPGLHRHRVVRGNDRYIVQEAARAQMRAWDEMFAIQIEGEERRRARDARRQELEDNSSEAEERTREAKAELAAARGLLAASLRVNDRIDWEELKHQQRFSEPEPKAQPYLPFPEEPREDEMRFKPQFGLLDKLWTGSAQKKQEAAHALFVAERAAWVNRMAVVESSNEKIYASNLREVEEWQQRRTEFEAERAAHNEAVERRKAAYRALEPDAISDLCELVLSRSLYPPYCPKQFELAYHSNSKTLVVEYELPAPADVPRLCEVKFLRSTAGFAENKLAPKQFEDLYGDVLYQIVLRTIHEVLEADVVRALDAVVFNGDVIALDPASGHSVKRCVLTIRVERAKFFSVNLYQVEAQECFRALGGVAGEKVVNLKSVRQVFAIDRSGEAFTAAEDLTGSVESALDQWQALAGSLTTPEDVRFIEVGTIAAMLSFPISDKYSAPVSRELAAAIAARGLAIEPDPRYAGSTYRATDEVVLFRAVDDKITTEYPGAAALLQLCLMIAAADDHITEEELKIAYEFIQASASLNRAEQQRLSMLERLLYRHPARVKRSLAKIAKSLAYQQRHAVGELLVRIAGADGVITSTEWNALDRACRALDLPASALEEILRQLGAELQEVTIQQATPGFPGEAIAGEVAALAFSLDMNRVARIAQETTEVVGILAAVLAEEEAESQTESIPAAVEVPDEFSEFAGLDSKYRSLVQRLAERDSWNSKEFEKLVCEFKLMPLAAFDALNEWSDEKLGDFILEGEDPVIFHRSLLPPTP